MKELLKMLTLLTLFVGTLATGSGFKVLLISMDGFRWDYIDQVPTPNFDALENAGVRAQFINNTFITKTFPCHYSIATGKLIYTSSKIKALRVLMGTAALKRSNREVVS